MIEKEIVVEEPVVTSDLAVQHGLTEDEYRKIIEILGRVPTYTELGIYSVMWSEHCSYKNSIAVLRTLPRTGGKLLVSAGEENAGLVDIGNGYAVAFKIESHNHPSAVEPYQGAATGVGGIMRDIFTMGARPIAALNSLRFGDIRDDRAKRLVRGVVKGIGDYGNSFGVPTVAGEVYFDPCYQDNPLVNVMAVGIVKHGQWASAIAKGAGNPVMIVGSATGRDGIHGATFASEEISEASEAKRPSVQVGDPFTEKLLLEASLEAIRSGYVVGIQDMGAAGITCSTSEMSAKGKSGMVINLDLVPARELGMTSYELMLSESQERMLIVVEQGFEEEVKEIFAKWDLHAEIIGEVTEGSNLKVQHKGSIVADVPAESLVLGGGAPVYVREATEPEYLKRTRQFDPDSVSMPSNLNEVLVNLLSSPNIASKRWVYQQYDQMVRTNNIVLTEGDAAVLLVKETDRALSMKTDCNGMYAYLNPYRGGKIAVAESARNVVCTGAEPLAITNCLNFGNPYDPEIYWQFKEAVRGIGDACRIFNTPVTGGNVSFYNEGPTSSVYPTPVIGMVGLINNLDDITTSSFKDEGDVIVLLGTTSGHVGGSEYLARVHGLVTGDAPECNLDEEHRLQNAVLQAIRQGIIKSAHDCAEGGLAVCIAECCILSLNSRLGAKVTLRGGSKRRDSVLFGEDQGRIVVTVTLQDLSSLETILSRVHVEYEVIGEVCGLVLNIDKDVRISCRELSDAYNNAIGEQLNP